MLLLVLLFTLNNANAQDTLKLKATAQLLLDATLKGDYTMLIKYTYPKVVTLGGGKDKMISTIRNGMKEMKDNGFAFHSGKLQSLGKIYKAGTELHCVLPHSIVMKVTGGFITAVSPLLCISADGGKNWTFISGGNMDDEKIKMVFPKFNSAVKLEKTTKPFFSKEAPNL